MYNKRQRGESFDYAGVAKNLGAAFAAAASVRNSFAGSSSAVVTKTKSKMANQGGTSWVSRRYVKTGRVRRRTVKSVFKNLLGQGSELITRWQNCSQTYIGPGSVKLDWGGVATTSNEYHLPIHFMSLTCLGYVNGYPNYSLAVSKGANNVGMLNITYDPTLNSEKYKAYYLNCVDHKGSNNGPSWALESYDRNQNDLFDTTKFSAVFHKYSDIKINLYGTLDVPIRYHVQLVKITNPDFDLHQCFHGSSPLLTVQPRSDCGEMIQDMIKPLLYNSVNTNSKKDWRKHVKVIKSCDVTIQPLNFSDQRAERLDVVDGQTIGHIGSHIHELRWFIRHDRFRKYDWDHAASEGVYGNAGTWDLSVNQGIYPDIRAGERLTLIVSCTAAQFDPSGNSPRITGSYDISVRNAFKLFQ